MKFLALAALLLALPCHAAPPARWKVQADVEMVALPLAEALRLVPQLRRPQTFAAAVARVEELVASGQAELLGWPLLHLSPEQRAAEVSNLEPNKEGETSSALEIRYPTEYDPPQLVTRMINTRPVTLLERRFPANGSTVPWAIGKDELGPHLTVRATVDSSGCPRLESVLEFRWLEAMEPALGARAEQFGVRRVEQPRIRSLKIETSHAVSREIRQLAGVFPEHRAVPRVIVFLLHATAEPIPSSP